MNSIANWKLECNGFKNGIHVFRVRADEICFCPICTGELIKKGWRKRFLIRTKPGATEDDFYPYEKICLLIQRHKCKNCGKIHHQLPDCIVPYKRYSLEIIEDIIKHPDTPSLIDEETVKRILNWWVLMVAYIKGAALSVAKKYQTEISPDKKLAEIVRILVNCNLWPGTRSCLNTLF